MYAIRNKAAIKERMRDYYIKNKDSIKQQKRSYYCTHKEHIKETSKLYRDNKKDLLREKHRVYRSMHLEALKESWGVYYLNNGRAVREKKRYYYVKNREAVKERQRRYRMLNRKPRKNRIWSDPKDVKSFFEGASQQLLVREPMDWYRISSSQIIEVGGAGLYNTFGSLGKALEFAYPDVTWDQSKFSLRGKKANQRWLRVVLEQILPEETDVLEDFLHPDLLWDEASQFKMELDIWVPKYQLAIEYQGEHHYHDLHSAYGPSGTLALYTKRDLKKKNSCLERGITLVTIPYWWDGQKESLSTTLHQHLPHIFPKTESPSIPASPPDTRKQYHLPKYQISSFLMHGKDWNGEQDPTGWFISEKLDGFRAFWDGSQLFSKNGKLLRAPLVFTRLFPREVPLDGELWVGYEDFGKLASILRRVNSINDMEEQKHLVHLWKDVKFCVFDAPVHPGHYLERHSFARDSISGCDSNISVIPIEACQGLDHLQAKLNQITLKKGEGVMLYHPTATYTSGRTPHLLKVKPYKEEDVRFLSCHPNSYSFLCEQQNGAKVIVKCSGWDYMFPPPPGTPLSVKHSGYFETSQKLKYPFLYRITSPAPA